MRPEEFVERWSRVWNGPDSDPELYLSLLHPGCRLTNPMSPITREELPQFMGSILAMVPDIRVVPIQWAETAEGVVIEWLNTGTLHGEPFQIRGVDIYTLQDGKGSEGISYFDPRPLLRAAPTGD
jgi:SnoaL-like domain